MKLTVNAIATVVIGFYIMSTAVCRDLPPVSNCISAATVLPLLGGAGDSPLVEARFNGMRGALFVSPQYGRFLVRNVSNDFWFPADRFVTEIGIDRQRKPAELTHVESLQFRALELHDLQAVIVDRTFPLKIGDLPIVGIIGRDVLSEYGLIELIDIPHNKLASITGTMTAAAPQVGYWGLMLILRLSGRTTRLMGKLPTIRCAFTLIRIWAATHFPSGRFPNLDRSPKC